MGAWGVGMQANDTALDGIGCAGLSCGEPRKQKKTLSDLRKGKLQVNDLFGSKSRVTGMAWIKKEPQAVLGLAEYLMDEGFDLSSVKPLVKKALRNQLGKRELDRWVDLEERREALLRFKARFEGKKVPQELLDRDNEGLLSKMSRMLGK